MNGPRRARIRVGTTRVPRTMLFALMLVVTALTSQATPVQYIDDAGRSHRLTQPAQRVVTLAPSLTELVYAVGGGPAMVGTISSSDYPAPARSVPRVGEHQRLDIERVLSLKPDLVLAWRHGNASRELAQLEAAGLRVFYLEPQRLDAVPRALERVGGLLGRERQGAQQAAILRDGLDALRRQHARSPPVRVFYQAWAQPLMTLSDQQLVGDVIALCGGRNVFGDLPQLAPQVSFESVLAADPEVILAARDDHDAGPALRRDPRYPGFSMWSRFSDMTAVRRGWLYTLDGDTISRQGPRILQGVRAICAALDEVRAQREIRPGRLR